MITINPKIEHQVIGRHQKQGAIETWKKEEEPRKFGELAAKKQELTEANAAKQKREAYRNIKPGTLLESKDPSAEGEILIATPYRHNGGTEYVDTGLTLCSSKYPSGIVVVQYSPKYDISLCSLPERDFNTRSPHSMKEKEDQASGRDKAIKALTTVLDRIDRKEIRSKLVDEDSMPQFRSAIELSINRLQQAA